MFKTKINLSIILLIILLSGILVADLLFRRGIFTAHDIEMNLIYFGSFYTSLAEGNIIPRWSANLVNLYGSPTGMFFYPFSYYLASFIRFFNFSLIVTMKIYIFIAFIASSVFMYIWLKNHLTKLAAITGAFLYVYVPYRINDIYARGSVAENTAFVFIPLVSLALCLLWKKTDLKRSVLLTLAISALALSHPFMLVMFIPFFASYVVFLKLDLKRLKFLILSGFLSLSLIAFYIMPLILENKYTHYDISPFNGNGYFTQFLNVKQLLFPVWTFIDAKGKLEYQTYQIGLLQIGLFLVSTIFMFFKIRTKSVQNQVKKLFAVGLVNFFISIFFMLSLSDFLYKGLPFLKRIEFPWRYMSLNLFSLAILVACLISSMRHKAKRRILFFLILFIGLLLYLPHSRGHDYRSIPDDYYLYDIVDNIDGFTTLPRWAAQPDIYPRVASRYEVIDGQAVVETLKRTSTVHLYKVDAKVKSRISDATFYFPAWTVSVDGKPVEIEFQDPNFRGIITFSVPKGRHFVEVIFGQTKVRKLADVISLLSVILIFGLYKYGEKI